MVSSVLPNVKPSTQTIKPSGILKPQLTTVSSPTCQPSVKNSYPNCYNCIILQVDGYEADDIIAALATYFGNQQKPVLIHSNDADFQSLLNDYVSITG